MRGTCSFVLTGVAILRKRLHVRTVPRRSTSSTSSSSSSTEMMSEPSGRGVRFRITSDDEMERLGAQLADLACVGDVILLHGDLGTGKTTFARGYIRHYVGDPTMNVTSPTYLLDNTYPDEGNAILQGVPVHHIDLWRLKEDVNPSHLNLEHVFQRDIALIEWPTRLRRELWPMARLDVEIAIPSKKEVNDRQVLLEPHGETWNQRIGRLG